MKEIFLEGMLLQAGLIFALGPQNIFVLESGLKRQHHLAVSFTCYACDFLLIMMGVAGAATFFTSFPMIKIFVGALGVAFLILYGIGRIRPSQEKDLILDNKNKSEGPKNAILSSISFSILNPHAYLDGIILIGGYSAKFGDISERFILGLGASTFSLLWFLGLSYAGGLFMPLFKCPKRFRFVMGSAGVLLLFLSAKLSIDVYGWVLDLYPDTFAAIESWP